MNIENALIIKTVSDQQLEIGKRMRDLLQAVGQDVVLVPFGVTDLFITEENNDLAVIVKIETEIINTDIVTGFNSVAECWEYARLVIHEAGLPEDSCEADVWDSNLKIWD